MLAEVRPFLAPFPRSYGPTGTGFEPGRGGSRTGCCLTVPRVSARLADGVLQRCEVSVRFPHDVVMRSKRASWNRSATRRRRSRGCEIGSADSDGLTHGSRIRAGVLGARRVRKYSYEKVQP